MKYFTSILILFFTTVLYSQTNTTHEQVSFIEVVGKAETEIVPNEIYLNIVLKERIEKGEKCTIQFLENQLKEYLSVIGVSENNLFISDVNAVLSKTGWWKEEVLSIANYTLKVNGASKLKKLFEGLKKLKISEVNITKATHSNIDEIKRENRIKAIKKAKEKSDYLLQSIGEKTGKPIMVKETSEGNLHHFSIANHMRVEVDEFSMSKKYEKRDIVQFEKIKIVSSMYVKFRIK